MFREEATHAATALREPEAPAAAVAPGPSAARVVIAAAPGTLTAAVVKAALTGALGVPAPLCAADVDEAMALLPADLLLIDARLAGSRCDDLARMRVEHPGLAIAGLADRPDEAAEACLGAAGISDVVLATDGQAAMALRLRRLLARAAEAPAPIVMPDPTEPEAMMRGLAAQLGRVVQVGPDASQVRSLEIALDRRLMDLMVLGGVARAISHAPDPLADLCAAGQRLLDADVCLVAAPCAAGDSLVVAAAGPGVHPGDVAAPGGAPELAAGLLAGERLFIPDAREHPAVPQELLRASGALSVVIEPVVAGEALLGALVLGWTERCAEPAARETALLRMLAAEAANALERAALIETMRDVARVDPLTGLPNRAAWDERLEAEIARAARTSEPLALLLLDVDGFTAYNRRFGRAGGNALLRALAAAWRAPLRASDVIARIGADEFAIMLPACSPDDAEMIAERINAETVGLATFGAVLTAWDGSANAAFLMARAESALAQARAQR
jgi:GGDEF domain-containing protein